MTKAKTIVYLVGNDSSPKTNQWLAMTNDQAQVPKLMEELKGTTTKAVVVGPPPKRRKKR